MQTRRARDKLALILVTQLFLLATASWGASAQPVSAHRTPPWGTPTLLETNPGNAQFPRLAADASGTAVAVWAQDDGSYTRIWASRYIVGQGWEPALPIDANHGDARGPWAAMDGSGNAMVVWSQYDGAYMSMWANHYVLGEGWGIPTLIESNPGDADFARVAMDSHGNAIAIWRQTDGVDLSIWANRYVVGEGWGAPTLLETNPGEASETWIAVDSDGDAMAVWRQTDGVDLSIWANRYVVGEGWGIPALIEGNPGFASFPHVVIDSHGNALVVWYQGPDSNSRSIWANRYVVGVGWETPTLVESNPGNAQGADVAMDSGGTAIAVWRQFDGADISIWSNRYVPGEGWGTAALIETNPGEAIRPAVAMDSSGNAVAVWLQYDGTYDRVWANRYQVGKGWGVPVLIDTPSGDARLPKVVMDSSGNALAVWSQYDGAQINIWANRELLLPIFEDVSETAGFLRTNLQSSWAAAWGDYDNDGHIDVITLGHNQRVTNSFTQLWRNNGDGTFSDVTALVGLDTRGDSHGAVWADFDNDGALDLFIAKGTLKDLSSRNYHELWRNNDDGTFTNIALSAGVIGINHRGRGVYAVDYDRDGTLDIFITSERDEPTQGGNLLYRGHGAMSFVNVAPSAGLAGEGESELFQNRTASWADFNGDGLIDVFLAEPCGLFQNQGDGTFLNVTVSSGIGAVSDCVTGAWGDYDNDGHLDLYLTTGQAGTRDILYRNNGDGTFTNVTNETGIDNPFSARSAIWGDYDNDGHLDLYVVNADNKSVPNRLFRNNGDGTFTDVTSSAGVAAQVPGGGADATFIDYNNDGHLDIFVTNGQGNSTGPYVLLKNMGNKNNWLKVNLIGKVSNRDGITAKISVTTEETTQFQEYNGPSHYMSQNKVPLHFGFGSQTEVKSIKILWPSRLIQTLNNLASNQTLTIVEGESISHGKTFYRAGIDLGYFIWKQLGDIWHIRWSGDGAKRYFIGTITTNGQFTEVVPIKFEENDHFAWDAHIIYFQSFASKGQDGLKFKTTGKQVTFDIKLDGSYVPTSVHLGKHATIPASLPLTLE